MSYTLSYHPSTPPGPVRRFEARARTNRRELVLEYALEGDIDAIAWPPPAPPLRTDGLWQDTCFEAFLQRPDAPAGYYEFNFSPSGAWAVYRFEAYREGMAACEAALPLALSLRRDGDRLELAATVALQGLDLPGEVSALRLGLSAVVKDLRGGTAYWACAHPSDKPDFHHAGGFVCALELAD